MRGRCHLAAALLLAACTFGQATIAGDGSEGSSGENPDGVPRVVGWFAVGASR